MYNMYNLSLSWILFSVYFVHAVPVCDCLTLHKHNRKNSLCLEKGLAMSHWLTMSKLENMLKRQNLIYNRFWLASFFLLWIKESDKTNKSAPLSLTTKGFFNVRDWHCSYFSPSLTLTDSYCSSNSLKLCFILRTGSNKNTFWFISLRKSLLCFDEDSKKKNKQQLNSKIGK